ncbi:MAG: C4-type zinc ribbon domain-containing protein [Candidatus Omnitrophota bacterium]
MDITEQITLIIELQEIDTQIFDLERRKKEGPLKIQRLDEAFKKRSGILKEGQDGLMALQVTQKSKENDLASKEEMMKKCQSQLYAIKTNKEYTAMQHEIKGHEADKSVFEEDIINILDEVDVKKKEIEGVKAILKDEEVALNQEKTKVSSETKEIEAKLVVLTKQRQEQAAKADKGMLIKYERVLKGKDGLAMVPVKSNACGGCNMNVPPQVINEIMMKKGLIFCESCARILYIEQ